MTVTICTFCQESGSPVCLRETFQGQGNVLVPSREGSFWQCTQVAAPLADGDAVDQGIPPFVVGVIPEGYRRMALDTKSFLSEDEQPLEGGAKLPKPGEVPHEE